MRCKSFKRHHDNCLIITSDQVASFKDQILTKPGCFEKARQQLHACSSCAVTFYTSLCVFDTSTNTPHTELKDFTVYFRTLSNIEIDNYLIREEPYDCAGSFKSEGLGITLFERMEGDDPNTLVGLPLIRLNHLLISLGVNPLLHEHHQP